LAAKAAKDPKAAKKSPRKKAAATKPGTTNK